MKQVEQIYINGKFVKPHGTEVMDLISPINKEVIGRVTLGNAQDVEDAVAAAKAAYKKYSKSSLQERADYLERLHKAVKARASELVETMIAEYGGTRTMAEGTVNRAINSFLLAKDTMLNFEFTRKIGEAKIVLEPFGVVGLITPWNANYSFICGKLATALASGSTAVIKPSELSSLQTQLLLECFHEAGLPPGLYNVVSGRGDVVGNAITQHRDIAKISFTGSTVVGKAIARGAVDTMKRVTLELGGKSPNILLDDADFEKAIPLAVMMAFMNSGQACIAGTRLLVPEHRLEEVKRLVVKAIANVKVGDPHGKDVQVGPMVTEKQYERVQSYIREGIAEGAELLIGGEGHPQGLENGNFVRPTAFANVKPDMKIAKEEIFGPVLSILTYKTEDEAIEMANDTDYGLHAYISGDQKRAEKMASQIVAGRVFINGMYEEPRAPFGGFKQSGIGREFGTFGLEAYLEPKTIMGHA
ncbi:aldehyde dehydrogenase family protein [Bdellovibrio sp. NC01]|uniref:aldehyde dehydrogenase family protein n=1 Tax=Bdellovibrio sp. NC01 TaxID=2220073 RepID=UPI0011592374|nr:aldehyde dehydrogenase family protein [Bdellovibrio sp. NC01]QDK36364.1 aldehyde dehydrogenase family protein [Bdellovibrio sp. NC01]